MILFDLSTQTRIQTLFRGSTQLGSRRLTTVHFNVRRQALLLATNVIGLIEHDTSDPRLSQLTSHTDPVNVVLYNHLFNVVGQSRTRFSVHVVRSAPIKLSEDEDDLLT